MTAVARRSEIGELQCRRQQMEQLQVGVGRGATEELQCGKQQEKTSYAMEAAASDSGCR